jgi:hypothetical protein
MVGNKRLKRTWIRNTTKEAAPKWSTLNEEHHEDSSLALGLVGWNRSGLGNVTRFVPYWWDEGGVHVNERYTALELFIAGCCTTTLKERKNARYQLVHKKGFFCVSTKFRGPNGELDNRFVGGYGHLNTKHSGPAHTFGRAPGNNFIGELNCSPDIAETHGLTKLTTTGSDVFCQGRSRWMQQVKVMCCTTTTAAAATHTHTSPLMH